MESQNEVVAIIPARGGSKGIVNKNVKLLNGKPLIAYSIEAAKNSGVIDRIFVSTDDGEIAKISGEYGAEVVPQEGVEGEENPRIKYNLSTESYLRSGVNEIKKKGVNPTDIIFIQCTSPLTIAEDIREAYEKYKSESYDSLFSTTSCVGGFKCGGFTWDSEGNSLNYDYRDRKRRQELPETFLENGAFYIFSLKGLEKHQNRLYGKIGQYFMPSIRSFEIDESEDWEIVEHFLKYFGERNSGKIDSLEKIKLLVLDFDGVLTNNKVTLGEDGKESVVCDRGDGFGIELLRKNTDVKTIVISKEKNQVVLERCKKLEVDCVNSIDEKEVALQKKMEELGFSNEEVLYVGNDLNDLVVRSLVRIFVAPVDANEEVKKDADYITTKCGGDGAVREICDMILLSKNKNA